MAQILPNFIIIGAMRSGTTSLARYLGAHPQVFMAAKKEVHFAAGPGPPESAAGAVRRRERRPGRVAQSRPVDLVGERGVAVVGGSPRPMGFCARGPAREEEWPTEPAKMRHAALQPTSASCDRKEVNG